MNEFDFMRIYTSIITREKSPIVCIDTTVGEVFVPREFIEPDGTINLNLSPHSVRNLRIENDIVYCRATFNKEPFSLSFPLGNIIEIFEED